MSERLRQTIGSNAELAKFLANKAPAMRCSACGRDTFAMIDRRDVGEQSRFEIWRAGDGTSAGRTAIETASVACTHCGKIDQFVVQLLTGAFPGGATDGDDR